MYIPYRPPGLSWMPSFRHWKDIANFSKATLLTKTLNALSHSFPHVLLRKLSNARGQPVQAYQLDSGPVHLRCVFHYQLWRCRLQVAVGPSRRIPRAHAGPYEDTSDQRSLASVRAESFAGA